MTREEFIKQRCEIDKITEEVFEKNYRVVECNCGQLYCKGYRCLDLDDLLKENRELKKQLEETLKNYEKEAYIVDKQTRQLTDEYENTKCQSDKVTSLLNQQKAFIKYLEDEINKCQSNIFADGVKYGFQLSLQKYKEITGTTNE